MIHAIYLNDTRTGWTLIGVGESAVMACIDADKGMTKEQKEKYGNGYFHRADIFKHRKHDCIDISEVEDLECVQIEQLVKERGELK